MFSLSSCSVFLFNLYLSLWIRRSESCLVPLKILTGKKLWLGLHLCPQLALLCLLPHCLWPHLFNSVLYHPFMWLGPFPLTFVFHSITLFWFHFRTIYFRLSLLHFLSFFCCPVPGDISGLVFYVAHCSLLTTKAPLVIRLLVNTCILPPTTHARTHTRTCRHACTHTCAIAHKNWFLHLTLSLSLSPYIQ